MIQGDWRCDCRESRVVLCCPKSSLGKELGIAPWFFFLCIQKRTQSPPNHGCSCLQKAIISLSVCWMHYTEPAGGGPQAPTFHGSTSCAPWGAKELSSSPLACPHRSRLGFYNPGKRWENFLYHWAITAELGSLGLPKLGLGAGCNWNILCPFFSVSKLGSIKRGWI